MTSNQHTDANPDQASVAGGGNVLRIVSGLHAGASRGMSDQEMILVGSGEDCDIVLADGGVASHHALISLVNGRFSLRALDAPLHVGTSMVHPGDPVDLARVQRVGLGEAALAFGAEDDPGWDTLLPGVAGAKTPPPRAATPYLRRLPAVAAVAVLSLASLAIFAAVMPAPEPKIDARAELAALTPEFAIADARTTLDVHGNAVLTGTVRDAQTRERIRQRVEAQDIAAVIDLRTGDDIARDVQEVLRTQGLTARTRYLGNGDVEAAGRFEDMAALKAASLSRAMREVKGINRVVPRNFATPRDPKPAATDGAPAARQPGQPVRIVSIVRGEQPHVVDADGGTYAVGADIPGHGTLISMAEGSAHVLTGDGQLRRIKADPLPPPAPPGAFANVKSKASPQRM